MQFLVDAYPFLERMILFLGWIDLNNGEKVGKGRTNGLVVKGRAARRDENIPGPLR